ncbi:MAG: GrpB-like predicted nucleotidyltransferase (UPF0157 family), partial [Cognaticolwellia sp.]
ASSAAQSQLAELKKQMAARKSSQGQAAGVKKTM